MTVTNKISIGLNSNDVELLSSSSSDELDGLGSREDDLVAVVN